MIGNKEQIDVLVECFTVSNKIFCLPKCFFLKYYLGNIIHHTKENYQLLDGQQRMSFDNPLIFIPLQKYFQTYIPPIQIIVAQIQICHVKSC